MYMAFATWRVFYNVYLDENHFSGAQIGIINALIQVTLFIIVPIWGVIADKKGIRPTLRLTLFCSGFFLLFLGNILNFWTLTAYMLLLTLFHHPLGPLIDALAVQVSEKSEKHNYGNLRLWGSFGWAVASLAGGYIFEQYSLKVVFPVSAFFFFMAIVFLGVPGRTDRKKYTPHFERIRFSDFAGNNPLKFFLLILFLYGIASSPINAYMNLFFSELGASKSVIGIAYTVQALSELPFFILGNRLLKRIGSSKIILISMAVMMIRFVIYAFIPGITVALIASALQGITLSFFLVGVVDYLHRQLPSSRHATAQSLLWGLYFGIGHTVGNLVIGLLKDSIKMVGVMQVFLFITTFIFLMTAGDFLLQNGRTGHNNRPIKS